jgi:hypothetical protein
MHKLFSENANKIFDSYECNVLITGKIYWTPFFMLIDVLRKRIIKNNSNVSFYEVGNFGIKGIDGKYIKNNYLLASLSFFNLRTKVSICANCSQYPFIITKQT